MAHGTPDYGATNAQQTTFSVADLGELAARIGSADRHDRRGDVIAIDSFEDGAQRYDVQTVGAGARAYLTAKHAHTGAWSLALVSGSTGGAFCALIGSQPPVVRSRIGCEVAMNIPSTIGQFEVHIQSYDGANLTDFGLLWFYPELQLLYNNPANVPTVFANNIDLPAANPAWNVIKLVADLMTNRYVRAIVNNVQYDLSAFTPPTFPDNRSARVDLRLICGADGAANSTAYVDDLIVTQNEP